MQLEDVADEEALYDGLEALARIFAWAIVEELSRNEGEMRWQGGDRAVTEGVTDSPSAQREPLAFSETQAAKRLGVSSVTLSKAVQTA